MRMKPLYQEFLAYLEVERNCSPLTVEAYASDGRMFQRALDDFGVEADTDAIDRQLIRRYIIRMRKRDLSAATVARRINSLRSFWTYIWDNQYVDHNPVRGLTLPKQSRNVPSYLSEQECRRILAATQKQKSPFWRCRDRAVLTFMLFTGARRSEVLNARLSHLELDGQTVRFEAAKGDKTRVVPLADEVCNHLHEWLPVRPEADHDYIFTAKWGVPLGRRGLYSLLDRALAGAEIKKEDVTLHTLRHSFACLLLKNGADLHCLQRMLGHTRLDTTGIYLQATAEDLKEAVQKHPLNGR